MIAISAEDFVSVFGQITQEQQEALLHSWSPPPTFTRYTKSELMPRIANALGCDVKTEHHLKIENQRIDFVLTEPPVPGSAHGRDSGVTVAVEHENDFKKSGDEICKLRGFDAPLCVLITYVSLRRRERMLNEYLEIIASVVPEHGKPQTGEILVIFGPYGMKRPPSAMWEYFVYREGQFVRLVL